MANKDRIQVTSVNYPESDGKPMGETEVNTAGR